jgi:hypothetical protein
MADLRWKPASLNRRQTYTITVANTWAGADTVTVTIDNVAFIITIGTLVTTAQVATTSQQALSGTTLTDTTASCTVLIADGGAAAIPQFSEFTATVSSSVVTLTGNGTNALAGKPFTVSVTETTAGTGTATGAAGIVATSQYHASEADNWGNANPADNDNLFWDDGDVDTRFDLNTYASGATTCQPASITKTKKYSGKVGLPATNIDNSAKPYPEYRTPRYFTTDDNSVNMTVNLETGAEGPGSGRFMLDAGAGQMTCTVFGTGSRAETGIPCILLKGAHASNVVRNIAGDVGIAFFSGETATVATLVTGDGPQSSAKTECGAGCTLTTVTLNGGKQFTASAMTTATQNGGEWHHRLGTVTALNLNGGTFYPTGAATITTLTFNGPGTFDCSKGGATFAITNTIQATKGCKIIDPQGRMGNYSVKLNDCTQADVVIIGPPDKTITYS